MSKKSWKMGWFLFIVFMMLLMINDAYNHPEDFLNGFRFFEVKH